MTSYERFRLQTRYLKTESHHEVEVNYSEMYVVNITQFSYGTITDILP